MDPEETLVVLRKKARVINTLAQIDELSDAQRAEILEHAVGLAEHFAELDSWLVRRGFLPRDWSKTHRSPR